MMSAIPVELCAFNTFLLGSDCKKKTNESLVKYLPKEITHKIWVEYAIECFDDVLLVRFGQLEILKMKIDKINDIYELIRESVAYNKLDIFEWFINFDCIRSINIFLLLVEFHERIHFLDCFKINKKYGWFLYDEEVENIYKHCIRYKNIDAIRWVHQNIHKINIDNDKLISLCCSNNSLDILKLFHSYNMMGNFNHNFIFSAANNGNIDMVEWLCQIYPHQTCICHSIFYACENCNHKLMKWLYENEDRFFVKCQNKPCIAPCIDILVKDGTLEDIKWVCETYGYFTCTKWAMSWGVVTKNIDKVVYLHENIPQFDINSHLYIGCSECAIHYAIRNNDKEMIKWFLKNRPELDPSSHLYFGDLELINTACLTGNLELVKFIYEYYNIFDITDCLYSSYESGNDELSNWLYKNRKQFPEIDFQQILNFFEVKMELLEIRYIPPTTIS